MLKLVCAAVGDFKPPPYNLLDSCPALKECLFLGVQIVNGGQFPVSGFPLLAKLLLLHRKHDFIVNPSVEVRGIQVFALLGFRPEIRKAIKAVCGAFNNNYPIGPQCLFKGKKIFLCAVILKERILGQVGISQSNKDCREAARLIKQIATEKENRTRTLYKKIYDRLYQRQNKCVDAALSKVYTDNLNNFIVLANEYKKRIQSHLSTEEEYWVWLNEYDKQTRIRKK